MPLSKYNVEKIECRVCGNLIPARAHVCLKCGVWTRSGPLGLYLAGSLKAIAVVATGFALPLVLLFASRKLDDRSAQTSRADRLHAEQTTAISKAATDAREATQLSIEVFDIRTRLRYACDEFVGVSAIAHEPWLGPTCATPYINGISALDVVIGKLAYRVDELPVNRVTVEDMRKLSETYWGVSGSSTSLRQELVSMLHVAPQGVDGVGLKYCGPLIGQAPDRRAKCGAQLGALAQVLERIGEVTNVLFCGLSHDLAEFRARVYEVDATVREEAPASALFAKRLRDNSVSNVCSWILQRAHGRATK